MGVCNCSVFCCTLLYVHSSIAIILMGKRKLVALLNLSSWCLVVVKWLFLVVPWGCLLFVIVVFPDHTNYFCYFISLYLLVSSADNFYKQIGQQNGSNLLDGITERIFEKVDFEKNQQTTKKHAKFTGRQKQLHDKCPQRDDSSM